MRIALCNEVIAGLSFERQCALAAALGYDGLEVAPFTLDDEPHLIGADRRAAMRNAAREAGVAITGLHWLLAMPPGLSITSDEQPVRARTIDVMRALIELCAELGGRILVHGSPAQRRLPDGPAAAAARQRGEAAFAAIADDAAGAGVAERNGHHYVDGFADTPSAEAQAFLDAHPDLYVQADGPVRLRIADGFLATASLACPGFASGVAPDRVGPRLHAGACPDEVDPLLVRHPRA